MQGFYTKEFLISTSLTDVKSTLSPDKVFTIFQDMASEHAEILGIGGYVMMDRGLFWMTIRTRIRAYRLPKLMEKVKALTWLAPFKDRDIRSNRYYRLYAGEELLAEGCTEWAVYSFEKKTVVRLEEAHMPQIEFLPEEVTVSKFSRFHNEPAETDEVFSHKVVFSDVDLGQHMNNCAYVRAMFDTIELPEYKKLTPAEMEICFRAPSLPGETVSIRRRKEENGYLFTVMKPDGAESAIGRLTLCVR